jgi:hypothetical protein
LEDTTHGLEITVDDLLGMKEDDAKGDMIELTKNVNPTICMPSVVFKKSTIFSRLQSA